MTGAASGLIFGALFGVLLQKARVARYEKQVGCLRLLDMTIVKFMFSAVLTGMVAIYALRDLGADRIQVLPTVLGANAVGGFVFGLGWPLLGYCPGTAFAALGEGHHDAFYGMLGMLCGAAFFAEIFPALENNLLACGFFGPLTLPQVLHVNAWVIIVPFVAAGVLFLRWLERKGL
ncbi:MAG TPA: DUF6691 family protein [bacterium]